MTDDEFDSWKAERAQVAQAIYEHLRDARQRDAEAHTVYLSKTRFFMGIVFALFAAMAYAVPHLEWAVSQPRHLYLLLTIGGGAALALFAALVCGVQGHVIRRESVAGLDLLKKVLNDTSWEKLSPYSVYRDVAIKMVNSISENRKRDSKRWNWAGGLHWFTFAGATLAAAFVFYALVGNVLTSDRPEIQEVPVMPSERNNERDEPPKDDPPSIVEPSDSVDSNSGDKPQTA